MTLGGSGPFFGEELCDRFVDGLEIRMTEPVRCWRRDSTETCYSFFHFARRQEIESGNRLPGENCMGQERRRTPRYPFIATAEVIDQSSKASTSTRVSELSLHGCHLDMPNPLPQDTAITVKI